MKIIVVSHISLTNDRKISRSLVFEDVDEEEEEEEGLWKR